jgi:hypothetical protein
MTSKYIVSFPFKLPDIEYNKLHKILVIGKVDNVPVYFPTFDNRDRWVGVDEKAMNKLRLCYDSLIVEVMKDGLRSKIQRSGERRPT